MPQYVHGDGFLSEKGARLSGDLDVFSEAMLNRVAAQCLMGCGHKERFARLTAALVEPTTEGSSHCRGDRRNPHLAAFARATDVGAYPQMNIADIKANQLGHTHAGLGREREQDLITPPGPATMVGCGEERRQFMFIEEGDQPASEPL